MVAAPRRAARSLTAVNVAYWKVEPKSLADNNKDNHGISSQKFHLLREFLTLGYSVFLSGATSPHSAALPELSLRGRSSSACLAYAAKRPPPMRNEWRSGR